MTPMRSPLSCKLLGGLGEATGQAMHERPSAAGRRSWIVSIAEASTRISLREGAL